MSRNKYLIDCKETIANALAIMNELSEQQILFVVDVDEVLKGTLTDGDVRRGLLKGLEMSSLVEDFMNPNCKYVKNNTYKMRDLDAIKKIGIELLPLLDEKGHILKLIDFKKQVSAIPVDAVIMAGGEGQRLRPLTIEIPKPLLVVGNKPIMEYGIDHLVKYGIDNVTISINYLGEKVVDYFNDGSTKDINIKYVKEETKLGTIGSVGLIQVFDHDHILVMNSDILTNIDLEEFYREYENKDADMSVACIPYGVNVPYAVLQIENDQVTALKEKPNLTFHSNAGIYLINRKHINRIPKGLFNATDLIEDLIASNLKVIYYPILGYWLDIGKMDDFIKAKEDIKHIKF